ncbi:MAG: SDR family oxidoreductase [Aeromicrobium sp.]
MSDSTLAGRTIVVTGAARGLGRAFAETLGRRGARVWIADVLEEGRATAASLRAEGVDAEFARVDLRDEASVAELAATVTARGPVYGLVNNAARADGVGGKRIDEITPAEWDDVMSVNVRGTWLVSRAFVPGMIASGEGRIVNLGSDAALFGSSRLAHYITSKGAVAALTRAMATDLGPFGVCVNTVSPGLTETEAAANIPAARHELYRSNRSLDRVQQPSDVTGLVGFLMSPEASYITGQQVVVNGGFVFH